MCSLLLFIALLLYCTIWWLPFGRGDLNGYFLFVVRDQDIVFDCNSIAELWVTVSLKYTYIYLCFMSRRRGQPSNDPKVIERRRWYETMEAQAFESRQRLEDAASVAMSDIHDMEKLMVDTAYDPDAIERAISRMSTGDASAPEVSPAHAEPVPLTRGGSFSSLALTLGEESVSRRESAKSASNFEFERIDKFKTYPDYVMNKCLLHLNRPHIIEYIPMTSLIPYSYLGIDWCVWTVSGQVLCDFGGWQWS